MSKLPVALHGFAVNCDNLSLIEDILSGIVQQHVQGGVQDWHYPMMEECFMEALRYVMYLHYKRFAKVWG